MIAVLVTFRIKPECVDAFKTEVLKVADVVVAEPECLTLDYAQDPEDPARFTLYEVWPSREYFEKTQLAKPYYRPYLEATQPMWAEPRRFAYFDLFFTYPPRSDASIAFPSLTR
jgi:quinol monooxygenase YgiN